MRKFITFLVSVSLVLTAHTGATLADSTKETYSPTIALTNVPAQDGYFGESFTWRDGRITQLFFVSRPEGCPGADADYWTQCAIWITDATGEYLASRVYLSTGTNQLSLDLKKPLKDILALGPITASIGTYRHSAGNVYGAAPPADFALSKKFQITAESLAQVRECNPFSETIASVVDKDKRQAIVEDIIFETGRNNSIIDGLRVGKRLNGVTQAISIKQANIGKATAVSDWMTGDFPESGYYYRAYDKVSYKLYRFDCSRLATLGYNTYSPFRFGKDGIVMSFSTLGDLWATNEWLTVGGKTYQLLKSGKVVGHKSGPVRSCKSIVRDTFDEFSCFIPPKPGTYDVRVKQQYVGSGNLIITCRGNIYSINCSTSRDKSVSRTLSGKFTIDSTGVVKGPGWWSYDYD